MSQLTYEQFEECFRVLFELQQKTDSKCQALIVILGHQTKIMDKLTRYRHRESTKMKTLRNRVAQLTAEKMTLKQQLTEWEKFK